MKEIVSNIVAFLILAVVLYFSFKRVINSLKSGGCGGCGGGCGGEEKEDEKGRKS